MPLRVVTTHASRVELSRRGTRWRFMMASTAAGATLYGVRGDGDAWRDPYRPCARGRDHQSAASSALNPGSPS